MQKVGGGVAEQVLRAGTHFGLF